MRFTHFYLAIKTWFEIFPIFLFKLNSSGVGSTGALQTMFYCEVTDDERTTTGGGVDDELIEVVECSIEEAKALFTLGNSVTSPPSMLLGVLWYLTNKLSGS